ncbi:MAG: tetratricopeptide repeat protein [Pyrinomonadaceae bacterium]
MAIAKLFACSLLLVLASLALTELPCLSVEAHASLRPVQSTSKQERVAALVAEGVAALERNDAATAKASFERALEIDRNNTDAHTYLGVLADRAGNLEEAERHFSAAAIAAPLSPQARNNHGAILLRMGKSAQAAAQFEISLRLDKNQPSALVNLAQIRFATGTPESLRQSQELFERAWSIAPDADIAHSLIVIALRLNDNASASRYFRSYIEQVNATTAVEFNPSSRAELGAALLAAGLVAEAIEELSAASSAEPNNVKTLLLLARAYMARKDIPSAGRTLEAAVARGLEAAPIYAALADVYEQSGHIENAIPAMRLAIERDPQNEFYRFRYGMLLTDTKAPAAAVMRLQEALQTFPRSQKLWFALGIAYFSDHKNNEAARSFEQALELDTKFAPALAYLGMMQAEQGHYAEAVTFYERAIALDERLAIAHYLAADALLKETSADLARALQHLLRAISLDQSFAPAQLALGKLYQRLNRFEDAARQFEQVIKLAPNLAEAHYQLGRIYTRLKRAQEAQTALATFKRLSEEQKEQAQTERQEIVRRLANVRF